MGKKEEKEERNINTKLFIHYNYMGWIILSFFLIFFGTTSTLLFNYNSKYFFLLVINILFGFIVLRLFLNCQGRRIENWKKIYPSQKEKYSLKTYISLLLVIFLIGIIETFLISLLISNFPVLGIDNFLLIIPSFIICIISLIILVSEWKNNP